MPARFSPSQRAFTLIELLVVIAIIAVLMGLLFPAVGSVQENARRVQAKNDATNIATAISGYESEYGKLPDVGGGGNANSSALFDILTGTSAGEELNPRRIVFLEAPRAKSGKNGLIEGGGQYMDSWGQPYEIVLDDDYDNEVDGPAGDTVRKKVIVWSEGNPKKLRNNQPNYVKSWE